MNLRKDHCTHKLQSQPQNLAPRGVPAPRGDLREMRATFILYSEALRVLLRVLVSRGLGRPPPLQGCIQLLVLSPPAGTLARGARSRPNPLAVTGLDPGLVPAGWGVLPREAREGSAPKYSEQYPGQYSLGGSPMMKFFPSPTRLRPLILTREFSSPPGSRTRVESNLT